MLYNHQTYIYTRELDKLLKFFGGLIDNNMQILIQKVSVIDC